MIRLLVIAFLSVHWTANCGCSWAQRTLDTMSLDEKVGQLFMIAAYVDPEYARLEIGNPGILQELDQSITQYHVGGLAFVGPSVYARQVLLTNHYQEISKLPLLIAQDLEWGLSMRIKEGIRFPKNSTLGAIRDHRLIDAMGREVGRQARLIGVHMNLCPVLDVNTGPENMAINVRSFGADPSDVAAKGVAMIQGLQDAGIIASAKHFPGLGDIFVDPHLGLPHCSHDRKHLEEIALYPFAKAIEAGVLSIQTEHLMIPALEPDPYTPSSLSRRVVTDLLKKEMGFQGLVLSGALRMKALTGQFSGPDIILRAFHAGSDMLLMPEDLPAAYQTLRRAVEAGEITDEDLNVRVLKILQLKERIQLHEKRQIPVPSLEELNSAEAQELKKILFQSAVTVVRDRHQLLPVSLTGEDSVAYIQLGESPLTPSSNLDPLIVPSDCDAPAMIKVLRPKAQKCSLLILSIYPADPRRIEKIRLLADTVREDAVKRFRVHGLSESMLQCIGALQSFEKKTVVLFFGNSWGLSFLDSYGTVIMAHEADPDALAAAVKLCGPGEAARDSPFPE